MLEAIYALPGGDSFVFIFVGCKVYRQAPKAEFFNPRSYFLLLSTVPIFSMIVFLSDLPLIEKHLLIAA